MTISQIADLLANISIYLGFILAWLFAFIRYIHMFQLNSYHAMEQLHWYKKNIKELAIRHFLPLIIAVIAVFTITGVLGTGGLGKNISIGLVFFMWLLPVMILKPKEVKKKLVYTPRVIRMCVTYGIISLIVLIVALVIGLPDGGVNGVSLLILSIAALLSPFGCIIANIINHPIEVMINNHYINDAKRIIDELPNLKVIGLTGSYGKTSTKFYLEKLLSVKYNVLMTPESYNTTMGVVKVVRGSLNATHDIFLCEMGAKNVGEIKEICDIVHPMHGIITSIGPQHLESFKTIENIINTKFELADALPVNGTIVLNCDNEYIANRFTPGNRITYGLNGGDYYADEITVSENGTEFTIHHGKESCRYSTVLIGSHNVQNIVGAIAMANFMGIPLQELRPAVKRLNCVPHRLQIIKGDNSVIIDDAFNSNPSGAKAALDTLAVFDGYKVLVTPGMVELGAKEYELNKEFGRQAAEVCDFVVAVGVDRAKPIVDGLEAMNYPNDKYYVAESFKAAMEKVNALNSGGKKKIVLLENDLPDNY